MISKDLVAFLKKKFFINIQYCLYYKNFQDNHYTHFISLQELFKLLIIKYIGKLIYKKKKKNDYKRITQQFIQFIRFNC